MVGESSLATVPGGLSVGRPGLRRCDRGPAGHGLPQPRRRIRCRAWIGRSSMPGLLPRLGRLCGRRHLPCAQVCQRRGNVDELPSAAGRDVGGILSAAADGSLGALPRRRYRTRRLRRSGCGAGRAGRRKLRWSACELRHSEVTERADVVFPGRIHDAEGRRLRQLGRAASAGSNPRCAA